MTKPIIRVHDIETNEIVDREMNNAEYDSYLQSKANVEAETQAIQAKLEAKSSAIAKLAALGLTEDEANAIVSA
jgi:hypothetical protein